MARLTPKSSRTIRTVARSTALIAMAMTTITATARLHAETRYTIRPGDTIYSIARSYNLSAQEVLQANRIGDPTAIGIGTNIVIPNFGAAPGASSANATSASASSAGATPTTSEASRRTENIRPAPAADITHTVRKGDTYFGIARRNNLSVHELLALNNRNANQVLRIGERVHVQPREARANAAGTAGAAGAAIVRVSATGNAAPTATAAATTTAADGGRALQTRVATTNGTGIWPHSGARTTVRGKFPAIVIDAQQGDVVRAVTGGRVVHIDSNGAFGQVVFVQSGTGHIYIYGGNDETLVKIGERITAGAFVGRVGSEQIGADTAQVYFSVWHNNTFIDPQVAPRG